MNIEQITRQMATCLPKNTIFHSSYFTPCPIDGMVQVTSLFDMIAETHYSIMGSWAPQNAEQKYKELYKASRVIAISNSAAADLIRFYPECKDKVAVVQLGSEHLINTKHHLQHTILGEPFVLFVGHRDTYKNFATLLDAMTRTEWPTGVRLHVVGSPFADHEKRLIRALQLETRVIHLGRLSDDDLQFQYSTAKCFVFPSLAEGFGLPILESQINGCTVACSDIAVFHEVADDAAVYFDPRLGESIAHAIRKICHANVADQLVPTGKANAERFSWDRAAEQTIEIYRSVANAACNL
jgi:glycosyltransferase involved in cell wall biosynthesis